MWGILSFPTSPDARDGFAPERSRNRRRSSCGANRKRIRTAKLGNRDKRGQLPTIGPELTVSGSDPAVPLSQDPAKAREFLGWSRVAGAKSLLPQTGWRWSQSRANPSPAPGLPDQQGRCREFARSRAVAAAVGAERSRISAFLSLISLQAVTGNGIATSRELSGRSRGKEAGGGLPREVGKPRGQRRSHDRASLWG